MVKIINYLLDQVMIYHKLIILLLEMIFHYILEERQFHYYTMQIW